MTTMTAAARRGAATILALTLLLGAGVVAAEQASAAIPKTVSEPIERADRALARASAQLALDHHARTVTNLLAVKRQVTRANVAAKAQIGKPPVDPESDDLPGPPAVFAVLSLEHRVGTTLVKLFDGQVDPSVVDALRRSLAATHRQRDALLDKVIALPAEGDIDDYADQIADRLRVYKQEVTQVSSALSTYSLTPAAHQALETALARVTATNAKVKAAFGGGE